MKERLKRLLPSAHTLCENRWLRWLGPGLAHPRLWHMSRRGVSLGVALGVFFGMLFPIAQMPASALAAFVLRANVPVAVASTLVTNPVTFAPLYYSAWRLGRAILGEPVGQHEEAPAPATEPEVAREGIGGWLSQTWERLRGQGKPLLLGLAVMATAMGATVYLLVSAAWWLKIRWKRHQRLRHRTPGASSDGG
jgi:uncharacterized protein (DUF2062 family)